MKQSSPRVGLQLYTLRELAALDLPSTLAQVAKTGYEGVELAGLHGHAARDVRNWCDSLGLAIAGAHISIARFESEPDAVASELEVLGTQMLVFPSLGPVGASAMPTAILTGLALITQQARLRGLRPVFHNHASEFEQTTDGASLWDAIVGVKGLELELDLGWAWVAGQNPEALLADHQARIALVHLKDHVRTAEGTEDRAIGEGDVDYGALIPAAVKAGVEWLVVEQDEPGANPLDKIARSLCAVNDILDLP